MATSRWEDLSERVSKAAAIGSPMIRCRPQKLESGSGPPYRRVVTSSPEDVVTIENPPNDVDPAYTTSSITVSTDSAANTTTITAATSQGRAVIWVRIKTISRKIRSIAV